MKWIHITEGYPNDLQSVLVLRKNMTMCVAYWSGNEGYYNFPGDDCEWKILLENLDDYPPNKVEYDCIDYVIRDVTHWMPLPQLPQEPLNKK